MKAVINEKETPGEDQYPCLMNNTYHKGINPESVPEMIEALNKIISLPQTIGHAFEMQDIAKKIIQKATL